jgi:hypothetical protein
MAKRAGSRDEQAEFAQCKCSKAQKELWERAAALESRSLSNWMRLALDRVASEQVAEKDKRKK